MVGSNFGLESYRKKLRYGFFVLAGFYCFLKGFLCLMLQIAPKFCGRVEAIVKRGSSGSQRFLKDVAGSEALRIFHKMRSPADSQLFPSFSHSSHKTKPILKRLLLAIPYGVPHIWGLDPSYLSQTLVPPTPDAPGG